MFHVSTNIAGSAAKEASRYAIHGVQVTPAADKDGSVFLCATDGRQLAVTEEEGTIDRQRIMPLSMSKTRKTVKSDEVTANGLWRSSTGKAADLIKDDGVIFPQVVDVCPDPKDYKLSIAVDVHLLTKLAAAIGSGDGKVTLALKVETDGDSKGKVVKPLIVTTADTDNFGILMPCHPIDKLPAYSEKLERFKKAQASALALMNSV